MEIKRLQSEVIAKIRSASNINNVTQCITELVLNSLDAKSTAIAVRVNLVRFRIQVVDNGEGITKENLEFVGVRYMTNKCNNLEQLEKRVKYYGFRGEALQSIIDISKAVEITSKHINSTETYSKSFEKRSRSSVTSVKNRPSYGTTVTIDNFLYNLPVRKNRIVHELELEGIKRNIEYLIIMHPNVSFSIRNDITGDLLLNSKKTKDIISSFKSLHPKINEEYSLMKVSKNKVTVEALLFRGLFKDKSLQYIYVNKRPVHCSKIQKFVTTLFYKNQKFEKKKSLNSLITNCKNKFPAYVINIKCPYSSVDILLNPSKTMVEFKNWNIILRCLEKLFISFFGNNNKVTTNDRYLTTAKDFKSECGVSQICGVVKGYGYKRNKSGEDNFVPEKVQKLNTGSIVDDIVEETQFTNKGKKFSNNLYRKQDTFNSIQAEADDEKFFASQNLFEDDEICETDVKDTNVNKIVREKKSSSILFSDSVNFINDHEERKNNSDPSRRVESYSKHKEMQIREDYSDICNISDSTQIGTKKKQKFRKPLPIKVSHKSRRDSNLPNPNRKTIKQYRDINLSLNKDQHENFVCENNNSKIHTTVPQMLDDKLSTLSKFTDDENKGKNLIMDMFLKSTQVFNSEEDIQSDAKSEETILEVESNFLLENNYQTYVNGLSKTMSVSVNIRSKKKIRKPRTKLNKSSKCVQTTLDGDKMVSKCIQTTIDQNDYSKLRYKDVNDTKLAENYTIVFSDNAYSGKAPNFKFAYKHPPAFSFKPAGEFKSANIGRCNCNTNAGKVFNLGIFKPKKNYGEVPNSILNKTINIFGSNIDAEKGLSLADFPVCEGEDYRDFKHGNYYFEKFQTPLPNRHKIFENVDDFQRYAPKNRFRDAFVTKEPKINKNLRQINIREYDKSPYFLPQKNPSLKTNFQNIHTNRFEEYGIKAYPKEKRIVPNAESNSASHLSSYTFFNPQYRSTQQNYVYEDYEKSCLNIVQNNKNLHDNASCVDELVNFTIDNFGNFKPVYKSTQQEVDANNFASQGGDFPQHIEIPFGECNNINKFHLARGNPTTFWNNNVQPDYKRKQREDLDRNVVNTSTNALNLSSRMNLINLSEDIDDEGDIQNSRVNLSPHIFTPFPKQVLNNQANEIINSADEHSKLVITLSDRQKQNILAKELDAERYLNEKRYLNWGSQTVVPAAEEEVQDFGNEWVKKQNNFGSSFYINKKTGFTTFFTPKVTTNQFKFDKRFDFMPKGLSPILKGIKRVDKSLSQNKKELLQNYILESHQDELLIIKWKNYIQNNDPKAFFEDVYKEKLKLFGDCIPSISTAANKKGIAELNGIISFDKTVFDNVTVIGQLDKKFIVVLEKIKNLIILFDQHAVHERIRLEQLMKENAGAKIECQEKLILFIPQNDLSLLKKNESYLSSLGLSAEFFENGISVVQVPLCLYNKFKDNACQSSLNEVVRLLLNEIIELLKTTRGVSFKNIPMLIQNIINLEACRGDRLTYLIFFFHIGAVKFGDNLRIKDCVELLKILSICKLPFQCAHGRPTLMPLLALDSTKNNVPQKPNFKKLLVR